jgi:lipopolysaccharide biosynthesis glycosyltransferase
MPKNIAFATVCTDGYEKYLAAFLRSLKAKNKGINVPFYVITTEDKLCKLSRTMLSKIYPNIIFNHVDEDKYFFNNKANVRYYSIDLFKIKGYEKVIYFGCDVICMDSISELFSIQVDNIAMTREQRRQETFNNNCMIVNGSLCNDETYYALLTADYSENDRVYGTDQKVYTLYFDGKIRELPQKWNTLVSESELIEKEEIKFLHYIYKPDRDDSTLNLHQWQIDEYNKYKD